MTWPFPPVPAEYSNPDRLRYTELPVEVPRPRLWKMLGVPCPGVEMHYAIATLTGDLDIDTEAELREEMRGVAQSLMDMGRELDESGILLCRTCRAKPYELVVRFVPSELVGAVFASAVPKN